MRMLQDVWLAQQPQVDHRCTPSLAPCRPNQRADVCLRGYLSQEILTIVCTYGVMRARTSSTASHFAIDDSRFNANSHSQSMTAQEHIPS
jgi:hypothetical protein